MPRNRRRRLLRAESECRGGRVLVGLLVGGAVLFGVVPPASAGLGFLVAANAPSLLTVGQTGLPSSLTFTNGANGAQAQMNVNVTQITLVPSCGTHAISGGDCPAAAVDPGVLRLSPTGVGESGTACAGVTFTTSIIDAAQGKYQFAPSSPVTLGPPGSPTQTCIIDFTVDVVKVPSKDADPASSGLQTDQAGFVFGVGTDGQPGGGFGTNQVTVNAATATAPIATAVSPTPIAVGGSFHDTATLTPPPGAVVPTGTVTFNVYGPGDTTCAGGRVFTSTNALNAAGTGATSDNFTPTTTGTYRVIAAYSGDANYNGSASTCNDPGESEVVTPSGLTITAGVPPGPVATGDSVHVTATLSSPPAGAPTPTGTVRFDVYGPGDTTCAGAPVFTSVNPLNPSGTSATSSTFTPASPGNYHVVATYSGDANYNPVASACAAVQMTVLSDELPTVAYTPSNYTPVVGETVSFDGRTSSDPDGSIVTYRWVWGDGTPDGSGPTPTHVFTAAGARSVALHVTDADGQTAAVAHGITVGVDEAPTAAYTPSTYSPTVNQVVSFDGRASSDADGSVVTYQWVWGDGTPDGSGPTPTHVFTTAGSRSVVLRVVDSDGQTAVTAHGIAVGTGAAPTAAYTPSTFHPAVGQAVSFDGRASSDSDGTIVAYRWIWGDGTPDGSGQTPTHAFATAGNFSTVLIVTDNDGQTGAVGHGIGVGGPTAAYIPSTYSPKVGATVSFDGRASSDSNGTITAYRWVWGDGTPDGSGSTSTHVFTAAGTRSVALYVTDSNGRTAAVGHGITVSA
jgi:PKD repeat protein